MKFKREDIEGCPGEGPYLTRWHLFDRPNFHIYLHRFNRSDRDRELHDHPWSFFSIILWGGYTEVSLAGAHRPRVLRFGGENLTTYQARLTSASLKRRRFYWPGSVLFRRARWAHRIEIADGKTAWSLVIALKKERSWGFFSRDGWIPWRRFTTSRNCG